MSKSYHISCPQILTCYKKTIFFLNINIRISIAKRLCQFLFWNLYLITDQFWLIDWLNDWTNFYCELVHVSIDLFSFLLYFFTRCFEIDMRVDWYFWWESKNKNIYTKKKLCFVGGFFFHGLVEFLTSLFFNERIILYKT